MCLITCLYKDWLRYVSVTGVGVVSDIREIVFVDSSNTISIHQLWYHMFVCISMICKGWGIHHCLYFLAYVQLLFVISMYLIVSTHVIIIQLCVVGYFQEKTFNRVFES